MQVSYSVHPRSEDTCVHDTLNTASLTSISLAGPHKGFSLSESEINNTQVNVRHVGRKSLVICYAADTGRLHAGELLQQLDRSQSWLAGHEGFHLRLTNLVHPDPMKCCGQGWIAVLYGNRAYR